MTQVPASRSTALVLALLVALGAGTALAAEPRPTAPSKGEAKAVKPSKPGKAVAAPVVHAPLDDAELATADKVYVGRIPCELGQTVTLTADAAAPGYFHLQTRDRRYHLRPVASATGAVRLEDPVQGAVWIQLGNKSMLMNQKLGRRLADDCMSPVQQAVAEQLKTEPAPNLLDLAQRPR